MGFSDFSPVSGSSKNDFSTGSPKPPSNPPPTPQSEAYQDPSSMSSYLQGPLSSWLEDNQSSYPPTTYDALNDQIGEKTASLNTKSATAQEGIDAYNNVMSSLGFPVSASEQAEHIDSAAQGINHQVHSELSSLQSKIATVSSQAGALQNTLNALPHTSSVIAAQEALIGVHEVITTLNQQQQPLQEAANAISAITDNIHSLASQAQANPSNAIMVPLNASFASIVSNQTSFQDSLSSVISQATSEIAKVQSVIKTEIHPVAMPMAAATTNSVWYTTWTAQVGVPPPIPQGVNTVYLSSAELDPVNGIAGLQGAFADNSVLDNFISRCHAKGIKVEISIGGSGSYANTWNQLTPGNVSSYASALANFCKQNGVDGIDFDWEPTSNPPPSGQGALVGQLIGSFKSDSGLATSLDVNAGSYWQQFELPVFQAAQQVNGGQDAIDTLNIMDYGSDPTTDEGYASAWQTWIEQNSPNTKVTVGMNPQGMSEADLTALAQWSQQQGMSTSLWYWDPSQASQSNEYSNDVWNVYHPSDEGRSSSSVNNDLSLWGDFYPPTFPTPSDENNST